MLFENTGRKAPFRLKAVAAVVLLGVLAGCSEEKTVAVHDDSRPVRVTEVAAADPGRKLDYSGSVKARTEMNLGFRVAGKITERLVDVGKRVEPGDVLARIDSVDYQLAVRSAEAQLSSANRQVENAELARRRAESLFSKNITSRSQLEQATLANDQAISARESAASTLDQARNQVAYTELKSDMRGIVTSVSADIGQVVGSGTPVVAVAVDGAKEVQIAVPEIDISHFKPGKMVKARFWSSSGLSLSGKVREVAGSADAQSRTFAVRVALADDPRVLLGMTASIEATEEDAIAAFSIPLSALGRKDGQPVVWKVDRQSGTVRSGRVTVADFSDNGVRLIDGVAKGDVIVSAGLQFMQEDMKVRLPEVVARNAGPVDAVSTAAIQP